MKTLLTFVNGFSRSFGLAFPNPLWPVGNITVVGIISLLLVLFGFKEVHENRDPIYFLLATLAATLGTVLVLAFTFAFVAAQIASRYSQMLSDRVLGAWAFWYAIPFSAGILLPLFLLHGELCLWLTRASLILGAFCILSLFPFAVAVRRLLSVSAAIKEKGVQLTGSKTKEVARERTKDLAEISNGALNIKDFKTFEQGVNQLVESAESKQSSCSLKLEVASEIGRMVLRNVDDLFASEELTQAIIKIGIEQPADPDPATQEGVLDEVLEAFRSVNLSALRRQGRSIELIRDYGLQAVESHQMRIGLKLQNLLYVLGDRTIPAYPLESTCASSAILAIGNLVQAEFNSSLQSSDRDNLVITASTQLESLGNTARSASQDELWRLATTHLQRAERVCPDDAEGLRRNIKASLEHLQ